MYGRFKIEDLNEDHVQSSHPCILHFPRNKLSKSVTVGSGRFIILNDSASHKIVIEIYLIFIPIFKKVSELLKKSFGAVGAVEAIYMYD